VKQSMNWFGTVRGRVGYAMDRTLVYATGGFAVGGMEISGSGNVVGANEAQTGYVLGGGLEHKLSPSWSIKGEYQFLSLDASDSKVGALASASDRTEVHTIRAGLNYHVGNSYEPLK
jgi:outer membrane immunogenic protein